MAQASGAAIDGMIPADFSHLAGVHYRGYTEGAKVWMSY